MEGDVKMEKEKNNKTSMEEEQTPINQVEGIIIAHELLEQGTKLIIVAPEMEVIPKKVKIVW